MGTLTVIKGGKQEREEKKRTALLGAVNSLLMDQNPVRKKIAQKLQKSGNPFFGVNLHNQNMAEMCLGNKLMATGLFDGNGNFIIDVPENVLELKDVTSSHQRSLKPYFVISKKDKGCITMMYRGKAVCNFVTRPMLQMIQCP